MILDIHAVIFAGISALTSLLISEPRFGRNWSEQTEICKLKWSIEIS